MASPLPDQRAQANAEVPRRLFIPKKLTKRTRGIDFAHQGMSKGRALADACSFLRGTRKQAAPPCRPPRRKLALPTLTRKPINWDSREAMESSFSRVFPIPPSCRKAPPKRRSNIAEKLAEKNALAMILGLYRSDNFRKPSLMPPPPRFLHNWARSQTAANGRRWPDKNAPILYPGTRKKHGSHSSIRGFADHAEEAARPCGRNPRIRGPDRPKANAQTAPSPPR